MKKKKTLNLLQYKLHDSFYRSVLLKHNFAMRKEKYNFAQGVL